MRRHVLAAQVETEPIMKEAHSLMSQRKQVEVKQQILDAFNAHFFISEDDTQTLSSSTEPVDQHFFDVLSKVQQIHRDCRVLLGTEDQTLGLEIMESSSRTLNGAFQKLYQWIQKQFKSLDLENPQISTSIQRALRVLAERPALFQSCLDSFAAAREHILSDSFHSALTGESEAEELSTTKPIEFYAHDPVRYVGDMLAWVHSASVSEREVLEAFFVSEANGIAKDIQAGLAKEPWSRSEHEGNGIFDGVKALNELVNRDLEGVGRSLRQRVEQILQSHDDYALAYRIANLIDFYGRTFSKLLGGDSSLAETLVTLKQTALRQFRLTMRDHVRDVEAELPPAPIDLSTPGFLNQALEQLKVLMKSYDMSLAPDSDHSSAFGPVLTEALEPFLRFCATLAKTLDEPAESIFILNCITAVNRSLMTFSFANAQLEENHIVVEERRLKLEDHQHSFFLHASGLHPLVEALAPLSESDEDIQRIASLPPFLAETLERTSQSMDDFLPSALLDATGNLKLLKDPKLVQDITEEGAKRFCRDFEFVQGRLDAADELASVSAASRTEEEPLRLRDLFPRTSAEVQILLS